MDAELADWMQAGDLTFLAYLYRHEGELFGPATIAKNTRKTNGEPYHRDYVGRRLRDLVEAGLVDKPARGEYTISELGKRYHERKVGPEDLDFDESVEFSPDDNDES